MTATTRGSPVGGNDSQGQGQAPDAQSQPPLPQNQVGNLFFSLYTVSHLCKRLHNVRFVLLLASKVFFFSF